MNCAYVSSSSRVIDADKIAREIMEPGRPAFNEVVASFGDGIVTPQGQINRQKLGELVSRELSRRHFTKVCSCLPDVLQFRANRRLLMDMFMCRFSPMQRLEPC